MKNVYQECEKYHTGIAYETLKDGFSFIFLRQSAAKEERLNAITEEEQVILSMLQEDPTYSANTLHEKTGKSLRTVQRYLSSLKAKEIIKRAGSTKGYWNIMI